MAAFDCPKHGMQIASHFCEHVAAAIDARHPIRFYLQKHDPTGTWYAVCASCARQPKVLHNPNFLVCSECVLEWAGQTGSDFVERRMSLVEEHPEKDPERE